MAVNPPLNVMEDQTDEDFFDKLVDDDFGPTTRSDVKFGEGGSDSDEAKAMAHLGVEDTSGLEETVENESVDGGDGLCNQRIGEEGSGFGSVMEPIGNDLVQRKVVLDSVASGNSGVVKSGVKEVGWGSFHADMMPNGNHESGSFSDFFNDLGDKLDNFFGKVDERANSENVIAHGFQQPVGDELSKENVQVFGGVQESVNDGHNLNGNQDWENMYPGWKYDSSTGQWYQVDSFYIAPSVHANNDANAGGSDWAMVSDGKKEANYLHQTSQSIGGTVSKTSTTENVSSWNQVSQESNNGYPEHMVFDPQYPGWYYDMLAQQWFSLESYTPSSQSTIAQTQEQQIQNGIGFSGRYSQDGNGMYDKYGQSNGYSLRDYNSQGWHSHWGDSYNGYNQQGSNMWQPQAVTKVDAALAFGGSQQYHNSFVSNASTNNYVDYQRSAISRVASYENVNQGHANTNGFVSSHSFVSGGHLPQNFDQLNLNQNEQIGFSSSHYGLQKVMAPPQSVLNNQQSYASNIGRSSSGRPPHALVTFGFGGKLIVMKDCTSLDKTTFTTQVTVGTVCVLNLMEVVLGSTKNPSDTRMGSCNYFSILCQQSFPGPLVGGSVGNKEVNKWIDDRIASCESHDMDYSKGEFSRLLFSLLKIACQHYGKLRSPFSGDASLQENDAPESAVAKLFASVKRNGSEMKAYGALGHCLQNLLLDGQVRATASEVQNLLVSGRKKEALQCAQEGQLWGLAIVLASQLGDQFYVDTIKQMALRQLVAGSPLRTLCLLIAGQPAEVFSAGTTFDGSLPGALNVSQQPVQSGANVMLDDWEENLALITANRTKDDELVIVHLGDCLWKDRSEIIGAHICYLVAEANFEPYSDTARLCLIAADHWKHPRTYANPEAIQRTELYEYSKVLGNSQFMLLHFQPYKLIYAYMLAEVGKVSDSLKYCQAILKSLKTGRAPEVETWKLLVASLEERLRTHQQGGYTANLDPAKLVGKLLNFFDSTAHRVVGGLPPPVPTSQGNARSSEHFQTPMVPRVSTSQSTMAMSTLVPSDSMEPISEWAADGNKRTMHSRSVSEPDFGRIPKQVDSSKDRSSSAEGKLSDSGSSRFGRFGFGSQLLQKTMGLVLKPHSDKQAKLGESNKFYYDEKLKRWVEEGAEPPQEEAALPPPPTTSAFQNGTSDYNLKTALMSDVTSANGSPTFKSPSPADKTSGISPIPTSSNQYSARGRMGVRARYVDTFNQRTASSTKLFHSPSAPSVKPAATANAKFFIPSPVPASDSSMMEAATENRQEDTATGENPVTSTANSSFDSPTSASSVTMQRSPSMNSIASKVAFNKGNGPVSPHSRRTASWSGSLYDEFTHPSTVGTKLLGEAFGMRPLSFVPANTSSALVLETSRRLGDDLHEVEF